MKAKNPLLYQTAKDIRVQANLPRDNCQPPHSTWGLQLLSTENQTCKYIYLVDASFITEFQTNRNYAQEKVYSGWLNTHSRQAWR